jgi:arsenate reductase
MNVLFVCIHNSARSQMAEAFLNRLGEGMFKAESAGLEKGTLNPFVVKVMAELGYDLSNNSCDSVFDFFKEGRKYDAVVKVCDQINGERCPIFPGTRVSVNWNIEDPSAFSGDDESRLQATREVRDLILAKVQAFIKEHKRSS